MLGGTATAEMNVVAPIHSGMILQLYSVMPAGEHRKQIPISQIGKTYISTYVASPYGIKTTCPAGGSRRLHGFRRALDQHEQAHDCALLRLPAMLQGNSTAKSMGNSHRALGKGKGT